MYGIFSYAISFLALVFTLIALFIGYIFSSYRRSGTLCNVKEVAFFHPYCNDGGGGERVLWEAVNSIAKLKDVNVTIFSCNVEFKPSDILARVHERFNIVIPPSVSFVFLRRRKWIEAKTYPYFTILGQCLGSVWLGLEALNAFQPDVFIDTMGYAFTYPLFKYLGYCHVISYTHYPTITTEMIGKVNDRISAHNNRTIIANSRILSLGKLFYYIMFAKLYGLVGRCADVVMVNSSWTKSHIDNLWDTNSVIVYPPCDVEELTKISRDKFSDENKIISIAQFRPEKQQDLQIKALAKLKAIIPEKEWNKVSLVLIGAARHEDDKRIVKNLQSLSQECGVQENVQFKINLPYTELKREFQEATIGIHSMWNEHFGIGVVECLAAGLITLAHNSGGPKMDIVKENCGFLAYTDEEYAACIAKIIKLSKDEKINIITNARQHVHIFSVNKFNEKFVSYIKKFLIQYSDSL